MNRFLPLAAMVSSLAMAAPAVAQTPPYVDSACGTWQGDTWTPNGSCTNSDFKHERLAGTIVSVKGHLVTLQQTARTEAAPFAAGAFCRQTCHPLHAAPIIAARCRKWRVGGKQ